MTRWHFIAIGGAGMSVVAELALAAGHVVTGSDAAESAALRRLADLGARVEVGHRAAAVEGADVVVVSSAIRGDNPELVRARELGVEVLHRSAALARIANERELVAVAGTHGKTTTSAMLAVALTEAGLDPTAAIGAVVRDWSSGARVGAGRVFVAEADESDSSFLAYAPRVAVVTNIEADHLDHYADTDALVEAFREFARRIVSGGLLVACADDPGSLELARWATAQGIRVRTYGVGGEPLDPASDHVRITDLELDATSARAEVTLVTADGLGPGPVRLRLAAPGRHTVLDAVAGWAAGLELGADAEQLAHGLARFTGTARRFETRGEAGGVRVVDDYAHNPTKVRAALEAARLAVGDGRVLVLFQPHLYSRTAAFATAFADALDAADVVVVTGIYGAREDPAPGVTSALVTQAEPPGRAARGAAPFALVPDRLAAAHEIAGRARPGDLVLTVGAGDVTELAAVILADLAGPS
ncbi:UDP-N-acetylmuramate/alanine ligase [Beutenbergia cavernae DSM 12333]|uniref:UDP-N-acetylmuramate--L-alanine ligase n=1 Tax=Beutenbergia cavernae (strain ATCC BAA-8 / DSM 12333 / CCUG 43141 / JCM 11478 / NBRC 16432 / NCIMB 13614 / HKI 0122) TaxID=471853 RepID=C5BW58_BEUC1|nr:UDP-N-acetylmuramate--L-alanine ligase [Beutenbergia cavernae]ACQ80659.1 UDP-N-acetylmuramate/alanine ligase [Beutenbergia cavernae DSM 12333]